MKRRLVTLAAAASLVVCIATVVLWVRSYWRFDHIGFRLSATQMSLTMERRVVGYRVTSGRGRILVGRTNVSPWVPGYDPIGLTLKSGRNESQLWTDPPAKWRCLGLVYWQEEFSSGEFAFIAVAHWWSILLTGTPAVCVGINRNLRRRQDRSAQICKRCGYDLRATLERCPECGVAAAAR